MPAQYNLTRRGKGLHLLSFDASGSRGISQLKILVEVMYRWNFGANENQMDRPHDIFDMIGGVGSGGFITILLVFLKLTAEEALEELIHLTVNVLDRQDPSVETRTTILKEHIKILLDKHDVDPGKSILDDFDKSVVCRLVVPISYSQHVGSLCMIRNYTLCQERGLNFTIADALLATLSTPPHFTALSIFKDAVTFEYTSADWTLSNPTQEIISEAYAAFGAEGRVACLLSLGSGRPGVFHSPRGSSLLEWNRFLEGLATDGEWKAEGFESQMGHLGIYHRFSVTNGLERSSYLESGDIVTHTSAYLAEISVSRRMDICVDSLKVRDGILSLDQLKHPGAKTVLSHQLPPLTRTFVMREGPWEFITKALLTPRVPGDADGPRMLVVTGMGGCGKTQLMLKFMKTYEAKFSCRFFVDGSSEDRIRADIIRGVRTLSIEHSRSSFEECLLFLSQPSDDGQYLLLYDNVDDPATELSSLLPRGPSCVIAVTSRNGILGDLHPDAHLQLDVMSMNEAVELLLYPSNNQSSPRDRARKDASAIAQELGCLPIALQQARSYMQQTKCSPVAYLGSLSCNRQRLLGQLTKYQLNMASISTYAAFETSFRELAPNVQRSLRLLSHFHWGNIPLELIVLAAKYQFSDFEESYICKNEEFYTAKGILEEIFLSSGKWDFTVLDDLTLQLQSYSLATVASGIDTRLLQLHPLVHEWVRSCIPPGERPGYQSAAVTLLALGARDDYTVSMQYLAVHVTHMSPLWDSLHVNNAAAFGIILHKNGVSQSALKLQEMVVRELREQLDASTAGLSGPMERLALTHHSLGRVEDAKALQEEVLKLDKEMLGESHPNTMRASNNLANTYCNLGRLKEAEVLQEEVLKLSKATLGKQHPDTIRISNNLAATYCDLGRLNEARELQEQVLKLMKEILGERHPDTISASNNLAATYYELGRLNDAQVLEEEVLDLRKEILGERHHRTAKSMLNLAITYIFCRRRDTALELLNTAERIFAETLGVTHPDYLRCQKILSHAQELDEIRPPTKEHCYKKVTSRKYLFGSRKSLKE